MISGLLIMGGLGILCGAGLALASKIFYVYVDPKVEAVTGALPGANCGGCGKPGCGANAEAIVKGKASPSSCVAGGPDIAAEIAAIMGVKLEAREPDIARPGCTYGTQDADLKYIYDGVMDCRAAALLGGGSKVCPIGCLGLGTCVRACPFNALSMGPDHLPVVNVERCTGCGTCERVCPKGIITLTSNTRRIQAEYTTDECTAPCQRACPAGIDIPAYILAIREKKFGEAVRIIKETNPFPLVCGRICVHPCEFDCRRNLVDNAVAINPLKRFVADYEMNSGQRIHVPRGPETGKRVAVIGGGAEGLTAAYYLNRLGHESTVYEGTERLGGLLHTGLPENRLPRKALEWEINGILDAGVKANLNQKLGKDFTIESLLKEGNSAVFVATGGWDTRMSEKDGDSKILPGVQLLVDFLLKHREGAKQAPGKNVMILGGGKAALDAAGLSLQTGSQKVYLVLRKSKERSGYSDEEIMSAEKEGVVFFFESALTKMLGRGGDLTQVSIRSSRADRQGEEILDVDTLMIGAGRFPELIYVPRMEEQEKEGWETVAPYPGPFAMEDIGIFRPGEAGSDYKAVVEAIGAGRRAANSVHRFLTGRDMNAPSTMIRRATRVLTLDKLEPVSTVPRQEMPELSPEDRIGDPSAEIALGFSEEQAVKEAGRCLQCGLICYSRLQRIEHSAQKRIAHSA
ncbi:MAG: electron transporter RnfB [Deltaproteobacteria bacterium HGW-Deltaproteobacteria-15]|jgi:NADPH-dependent glutamate synthase beta subunit-like oxidoreductase|nr:MAG: electron transporter RnfB [Deltaproteobacteria bacterium HGW-Deltaproteobacteria-15]